MTEEQKMTEEQENAILSKFSGMMQEATTTTHTNDGNWVVAKVAEFKAFLEALNSEEQS
jgi:hypothetical protein